MKWFYELRWVDVSLSLATENKNDQWCSLLNIPFKLVFRVILLCSDSVVDKIYIAQFHSGCAVELMFLPLMLMLFCTVVLSSSLLRYDDHF